MNIFNRVKDRMPKTKLYEDLPCIPQSRDIKIGGWVSDIGAFYGPDTVKDYLDLLIKDCIRQFRRRCI